jgi:N-acetylmuramoyl-L-alanine amidase
MRTFFGIGVFAAFLMIAYGVLLSDDSQTDSDANFSDNAVPGSDSTEQTPVPTMQIELGQHELDTNPADGAVSEFPGDQCFDGVAGQQFAMAGSTIIVDPGHGGEDLGTVNMQFGLSESELVLSISHMLRQRLTDSGADVCMTRVDDSYVTLRDRAAFANSNDGDIFVSIHLNSLPDADENYTMTMWGNEAKDRYLAEQVVEVLRVEMARPDNHHGNPNPMNPSVFVVDDLNSTMLKTADMPAVLVEASFLSNSWEAQVFLDGIEDGSRWREHQIADAVHLGLENYFASFE